MTINSQTRISTILRKSPLSLYAIVKLSPKFSKLRNPVLRKIMAPRVSIAQAAKIGGCTPQHFFDLLKPLGFVADDNSSEKVNTIYNNEKPNWIINADNSQIKLLDVRPILENKQDPLNHILDAVKMLHADEILCILNSFEPTPLINLLRKKRLLYHVEKMQEEEVFTYFKKQNNCAENELEIPVKKPGENSFDLAINLNDNIFEIDVRELEMPQPMLTILQNLETLPQGFALLVNHKRVPVYLLPELEERGFQYHIKEISEGDIKLLIHRE
jgi:uncharacterized protein (DUF2249 family)